MGSKTIYIEVMGKPRMSRKDKWLNPPRDCVGRYWKYKDKLKEEMEGIDLSDCFCISWTAYFPIPKSWSKNKKEHMRGKWHQQKPDRDNIDKGILDALLPEDCMIASGSLQKHWDDGGGPRLILRWI